MRVAIYGAGSLGTILGAFISKAGVPIELINRNKAHVEGLKTKGAQVVGTMNFCQPVVAYTPDEMSGEYDILFLMTKQQPNTALMPEKEALMSSLLQRVPRKFSSTSTVPISSNISLTLSK